MTDIPVNHNVLVWARKQRGLTTDQAAQRLRLSVTDLVTLEKGLRKPNISQLRIMAEKYQISFAALLMPEPLPASTKLNVTDFRTHQGGGVVWGPELLAELDDLNDSIDALADLRDYSPGLFGSMHFPLATIKESAIVLANSERGRLKFELQDQLAWPSEGYGFRYLRQIVEDEGIFVYVIKADTTNNWRGLTIIDERRIPVIMINGAEPSARYRLFSLMHEYAHALLRMSVISSSRSKDAIERFCNQFAAFFLMPKDIFTRVAKDVHPNPEAEWHDREIRVIAEYFKTSLSSVALHLEENGLAAKGLYKSKSALWRSVSKPSGKGPGYYAKMANRLGVRHISVVLNAREKGILNDIDTYELLNVAPANFANLQKEVSTRVEAYGRRL